VPGKNDFFQDLDDRLGRRNTPRTRLQLIGSVALMGVTGQSWGTEDADILEALDLSAEIKASLLELGGPGSDLAKRHGLYLEFVPNGLPLLPQKPAFAPLIDLEDLKILEVQALDVTDGIVSKLARFNARDVRDIRRMADIARIDHERLLLRFKPAIDLMQFDARADRIPKYLSNLHTVERDILLLPETPIDLPDSA